MDGATAAGGRSCCLSSSSSSGFSGVADRLLGAFQIPRHMHVLEHADSLRVRFSCPLRLALRLEQSCGHDRGPQSPKSNCVIFKVDLI